MKSSILKELKEAKQEINSNSTDESVREALTASKSFFEKASEVLTIAAKVSTVLAKATENESSIQLITKYVKNYHTNSIELLEGLVDNHYEEYEACMEDINAAPHDEEQQESQQYAA